MSKIKVYAKSSGDKNAAILIDSLKDCPSGHTSKVPPDPKDNFTVKWNSDLDNGKGDWECSEIPEPEEPVMD